MHENIHRYFNNTFHEFKIRKKVILTETFNFDFHNKFIKFGLFCFFVFYFFLIYFYIYIYIYIYHRVVPLARISLTLSRHFSLSFIASGRSSGLHPISSHSCWMYVQAGRPAFARPYVGVHRSTSLMSSSLLLQQYTACLFRLTWIAFVMGGRWPYSWWFLGCCRQH